jgi:hypothetical protein
MAVIVESSLDRVKPVPILYLVEHLFTKPSLLDFRLSNHNLIYVYLTADCRWGRASSQPRIFPCRFCMMAFAGQRVGDDDSALLPVIHFVLAPSLASYYCTLNHWLVVAVVVIDEDGHLAKMTMTSFYVEVDRRAGQRDKKAEAKVVGLAASPTLLFATAQQPQGTFGEALSAARPYSVVCFHAFINMHHARNQ